MKTVRTALPVVVAVGALILGLTGCSGSSDAGAKNTADAGSSSTAPSGSSSGSSAGSGASGSASSSGASGSSGSSQTKTEACTILASSMQELSTSMTSSYSKLASDPDAAEAALKKLADTFHANEAKVTEPGALAVAKPAGQDLDVLVSAIGTAKSDPQGTLKKTQDLTPKIQKDFAAVGTYCS